MKPFFSFIAALAFSATAWGQQNVTVYRWNEVPPALLPPGGKLVSFGDQTALRIENPGNTPLQLTLLTIPDPKVSSQVYAIQGEVREEALRGNVFMDMWSYFTRESPHSSRVQIHASSNWASYSVPFDSMGGSGPPARLQITLWLGGRGTIFLGPLKLVQYVDANKFENHSLGSVWLYGRTANPWWSNRTGAHITNVGTGILLGLGFLMGGLCSKRKAHNFVTIMLKIHIALGFAAGAVGLIAIFRQQAFVVWFPLLLSGIILIGVYRIWLVSLGKYYSSK